MSRKQSSLPARALRLALRTLLDNFGTAFLVIPRRWRFATARTLVKAIYPLNRFGILHYLPLNGYREMALRHAIVCMDRSNVRYTPEVTVRGAELLSDGGALLVTGHFFLTGLFVRWLTDCGRDVSVIWRNPAPGLRIVGTDRPIDAIPADAMSLVRARQRVRDGRLVLVEIDQSTAHKDWHRVETPHVATYVSDAALKFAERTRIPVVFCATRIADDGALTVTITRPSSSDASTMLDEFMAFLRSEAEQIQYIFGARRSVRQPPLDRGADRA